MGVVYCMLKPVFSFKVFLGCKSINRTQLSNDIHCVNDSRVLPDV